MCAHALRLVLAGFLSALSPGSAIGDDILLNSDFTDGKTHWQGGGEEPANMGGKITVTLDAKKWTVLYQHFNASSSTLKLTVVYSVSNDCSLVRSGEGNSTIFTEDDLEHASGLQDTFSDIRVSAGTIALAFSVSEGEIVAMDNIGAGNRPNYGIEAATSRRTFSESFDRWIGQFRNDEFCLAFPPGQGTITLMKVALTKPGP